MASKGFPNSQIDKLPVERKRELTDNLIELNAMGRCRTDAEVEQRIEQYFSFLESSALRPSVETLCVALHISRTTLFRWKHGTDCSEYRQELVTNALQVIASFLEQAVMSGGINPASGIFLMKNWLGYKDTLSIEDASAAENDQRKRAKAVAELPRFDNRQQDTNFETEI